MMVLILVEVFPIEKNAIATKILETFVDLLVILTTVPAIRNINVAILFFLLDKMYCF